MFASPVTFLARPVAVVVVAAFAAALGASPAQAGPDVWDRVAFCESTENWSINSGNSFYGGLQFTKTTWLEFGGGKYAPFAHQATKAQQIEIAQKVLIGQGPGAWPVCSVKAGLTRANGAARVVVRAPAPRKAAPVATAPVVTGTLARALARHPSGEFQLAVDGVVGPLTRYQMKRHGVRMDTPWTINHWQTKLGVKVDGVVGPKTAAAMQRHLNAR